MKNEDLIRILMQQDFSLDIVINGNQPVVGVSFVNGKLEITSGGRERDRYIT